MIAEVTPLKADPTIVDEIWVKNGNTAQIEMLEPGLYWMGTNDTSFYIYARNGNAVIQTAAEYYKERQAR